MSWAGHVVRIQSFGRKNLNHRYHMEDVGIGGRIILKLILEKWAGRMWTGFIWLRIGTSCWLLWTRWWTFRFHKGWDISWVAKRILASRKGCYSPQMELIFPILCRNLSQYWTNCAFGLYPSSGVSKNKQNWGIKNIDKISQYTQKGQLLTTIVRILQK
jgi:hypothetical protein